MYCIDSEAECLTLYHDPGTQCWIAGGGGTSHTCHGRSCDEAGTCAADDTLSETCDDDAYPTECGPACRSCTELTCSWIEDPGSGSGMQAYCRPEALVGIVCDDGDPCTAGETCVEGVCAGGAVQDPCCGDGLCEPAEACACVDDCLGTSCGDDPCVPGQSCQPNGACGGGQVQDPCCGDDVCAPAEVCACVDDCLDESCDDGDPMTSGDACQVNGSCAGQTSVSCGPLDGSDGTLGSVVLLGAVTINTSTGAITAGGDTVVPAGSDGFEVVPQAGFANGFSAPGLAVFHFSDLEITAGAQVTVTGANGLALLATGELTVAGQLSLSGTSGVSGGVNQGGSGGGGGGGGEGGDGASGGGGGGGGYVRVEAVTIVLQGLIQGVVTQSQP